MTRRGVLFFVLSMALAATAQAVEYTNSVLDLGVGGRALGMGGAYVALADDSTSTYWNPAGLTGIKDFEVMVAEQGTESSALDLGTNDVGSDYLFMSGGMTAPGIGSFGLSVMRFGDGGIPQVPGSTNPTCATCPPPAAIGTFSVADWGVFASYARNIVKGLDLGVTAKMLYGGTQGLQNDSSSPGGVSGDATYDYFGLDLGLKYKFGALSPSLEGLNFGLNLQDLLNTGVKWSGTGTNPNESVNMNPKTGLSYSLPFDFLKQANTEINLAMDVDPNLYAPTTLLHYGAEIWYKEVLAFRGGLMQFTDSAQGTEPSIGASFRLYILQVDYTYIYYELTPIQYLDLAMRW